MAVRPIDAVQVLNDINRHHKPTPVSEFESGFNQGLNQAMWIITHAPTLTPPNEWVSVEERLPEDEARQYIKDNLDGIGYLYPCLLTYKSPNTERIHVVRFYYDIIQKWFVNNGEELCEKGRCIAWMPLPAPYDRCPPEGQEDT